LLKLKKLKTRFFNSEWDERNEILKELYVYSEISNVKISEIVLTFLRNITEDTRGGMTSNTAISIFSLSLDFFPYFEDIENDEKIFLQLGEDCIYMAFNMVYDASIYLNNFEIIMHGLTILKFIYKKGKENNSVHLIEKVKNIYTEIESKLNRPERNDLEDIKELVSVFKEDIEEGTLSFPPFSDSLYEKYMENKKVTKC